MGCSIVCIGKSYQKGPKDFSGESALELFARLYSKYKIHSLNNVYLFDEDGLAITDLEQRVNKNKRVPQSFFYSAERPDAISKEVFIESLEKLTSYKRAVISKFPYLEKQKKAYESIVEALNK